MYSWDWVLSTPRLEPVDYFRKPQVLARLTLLVLVIVVISVVHNNCYLYDICVFNDDQHSCRFTLFISSISLVTCVTFLLVDIIVDNISNLNIRKQAVFVDMSLSGVLGALCFVDFCLLCNRWQNTPGNFSQKGISYNGPRSAIAFVFFSTIGWCILTYLAYRSYESIKMLYASDETDAQTNAYSGYIPNPSDYNGFTNDTTILDTSGSPNLGINQQTGNIRTGIADGLFSSDPLSTYQP